MLVKAGADLGAKTSDDVTPLHLAAQFGHWKVMTELVKAGADLEAKNSAGSTPLHVAAQKGHSTAMEALIDAGANPDTRLPCGETPLYSAAVRGDLGAIRMLLRAKVNPLLGKTLQQSGQTWLPLTAAVVAGHPTVVLELIQQVGIEGSCGAFGEVEVLRWVTKCQHLDIMAILVDAGVVDTGLALCEAAKYGGEPSVKFLLQQQEGKPNGGGAYVNVSDAFIAFGATPL